MLYFTGIYILNYHAILITVRKIIWQIYKCPDKDRVKAVGNVGIYQDWVMWVLQFINYKFVLLKTLHCCVWCFSHLSNVKVRYYNMLCKTASRIAVSMGKMSVKMFKEGWQHRDSWKLKIISIYSLALRGTAVKPSTTTLFGYPYVLLNLFVFQIIKLGH